METYCGMDLGKKYTHICIVDKERKVVCEKRVRTGAESVARGLAGFGPMRVVLEASGRSFWLADIVESMGHEVIVVDPGRTKAIGAASIKHDRLDARVLAELCQTGLLAKVYRPSKEERVGRMPTKARSAIVRARVKAANSVRGILESEGFDLGNGTLETLAVRVRELEGVDVEIREALEPLLASIEGLTKSIEASDELIRRRSKECEVSQLLQTAHGVGPIVAACFVGAINDPSRFARGRDVGAYLGLAPKLYSSGKTHRIGSITKRGNRDARWALTLAANAILRGRRPSALRTWAQAIAERQGRKTAVVALARRLAGVLWAMWRDGTAFRPGGVADAAA